jgi:Glutathione S-transferase, N-terminal domain
MREMELYVCYGTFPLPGGHPCAKAYQALTSAGHKPRVVRTYGCYGTDRFFSGRQKIKKLTGSYKVPTLVLDDNTIIDESDNIVAWANDSTSGVARSN